MSDSRRAIFVSYASEDSDTAKRICGALLAAGLEVWFDQSELRGGDAWDASIRTKIKDCALFMPIISANTESRGEGYFRLEWKLAVDRSHLMADDQAFLLPVVIDETAEATARVPDGFRVRQWMRLPGAVPTPEFVAQVRRLLGAERAVAARDKPDRGASATRVMARPSYPKGLVAGLGAAAFALLALIAYHYVAKDHAAVATSAPTAKPDSTPAVANPQPNSVAVLAFANLSGDKDNEYFSDGVSEELLTVLQKIPGLHVAARLSSFSFKGTNATTPEIGRKLGVSHLIEGSVRKSGQSVRITARLSRAANGEQLWSDGYTRDLKDVFAMQSELAQTIVEQLRAHLGGTVGASAKAQIRGQVQAAVKGGTKNAEAHQLYLQGLFYLHQFSVENAVKAQRFLERAVVLDPAFALAWSSLSRAGAERGAYASTTRDLEDGFALARRAADRALALEPELPSAQLARMWVQMWNDFDWKGATQSLRRAQRVAPADADVVNAAATLAYSLGQKEIAVDLAQQAVSLDPLNPQPRGVLGYALDSVGRYREAEAQFRRVYELSADAPWGHAGLGNMLLRQERFEDAVREAGLETTEWSRLTVQAQALWALKKRPESDAALARLVAGFADVAAFQIAQVHAYRRENDRAFHWLERAARQRDSGLAWCKSDATLVALHGDPRWPVFLKRIGLADEQLK